MSTKRLEIFLLFGFFLVACSHSLTGYPTLVNQGPLPVSATNPYVGTNLFLADEFQKSSDLFNFFKARGAPAAIDISEGGVAPARMRMFYTADKQFYVAELQSFENGTQWVVRGPYSIGRQDYKRLPKEGIGGRQVEPVFAYGGENFRFKQEVEEPRTVVSLSLPPAPKPKKKIQKTSKVITRPESPVVQSSSVPALEPVKPRSGQTFDQQAIEMSKNMAERDEQGDVVHVVKKKGETLKDVVLWHAGSLENAQEIAKKNNLAVDDALPVGKKVVIPSILVREFRAKP